MKKRIDYYNRILQEKPIFSQIADELELETKQSLLYVKVWMPVLIEYVSWVLNEAYKDGKTRLYFLARDGYQMYLVAQKLCQIKKIPMDCRYLKVSRYAMRLPEYHLLGAECVEHICIGGIDVTLGRIMRRGALSEEAVQQYLPGMDSTRILNYQEIMQIKEVLRQNEAFIQAIGERSKATYEPAMAYLEQEGLFDDVAYALVDSGWVGTLQKTIAHLVGRNDLEGYYFGMYETPKGVYPDRYHSFYFGPKWGMKRKVSFSNCLFEAVLTSPQGMTLGYEKKGEHFFPVADFEENPNKEQVIENCRLLEQYMDIYRKYLKKHMLAEDGGDSRFVEKLLSKMMGTPTELETAAYGEWLFSDDVLENNLKKVAADLSLEEIKAQRFFNKALIMLGVKQGTIHESAWLEGSIIKEGSSVKTSLLHARLYKYFIYIKKLMK